MLLSQLKDYLPIENGEDSSRPYSRIRSVQWQLSLNADGTPRGPLVALADPSDKTARLGRQIEVPNSTRTVGIAPNLGADDIQYVLGWVDEKSKPDRVARAHHAFVDQCQRWWREHPEDQAAAALVRFYDRELPSTIAKPTKWSSKDLVIVQVAGRYTTDSDSLWRLWKAIVEERKSGGSDGAGRRGLCIVCGRIGSLLDRMPQSLPKMLIPRADQEIALISANKPTHGYDYRDGLQTAQICIDCGQAAVANLTEILGNEDHTFSYPQQRTRMAWWITNQASSKTIELLAANQTTISDYLRSLATGKWRKPVGVNDPEHTFCSVTVSGNVARLVVHDWIEMPLGQAERNVHGWFDDLKIETDRLRAYGIWALVWCAGQWQPSRNSPTKGSYIPLFDKAADRPDDLAQLLLHSALHGGPLSPHVLSHLVRRIRTDMRIDTMRAALLRLALTRLPNRVAGGPTPMLDETQDHPAYLNGRLFSVLQSLQYRAFPKDDQPNSTFFDRYFAGAVANPRIAFVQGAQMYPAWRKKLLSSASRAAAAGKNGEAAKDRAAARRFELRIGELQERLTQPPRPLTSSEDQSWFVLGYFHQRAHDFRQAMAGKAPEIIPDPRLTDDPDTVLERNGDEDRNH
jgi:CRISPR-associated protein Csd1